MPRHLGVVRHSRGGSTGALCDAAETAARGVTGTTSDGVELRVRGAFDAGPDDVEWADALLLATPAHFGYMSGALKDFFERIYHPCLGRTTGLPYGLIVKGDTDVDGAVASVRKIATGLGWNLVLPPVTVVGAVTTTGLEAAADLGATLAAGLGEGIF
ncbi:MAG TPA: NAD(P)H-dependent oxidoreductase [Acidimicrobiales bacterium]|nr:NAD(P)H-dependent oxidoreductase [Acidimicrobiales bacterium]